jgi:hypothetical protein
MLTNFKLILLVFCVLFSSVAATSQTQIKKYLVESIQNECDLILKGSESACSSTSRQSLLQKFEEAEIFISSELMSMDFKKQRKYHEKYLQELADLESVSEPTSSESKSQFKAMLNKYLLIAATKPKESEVLFKKIVFLCYGLNPKNLTYTDSTMSYGFFQNWLYGLLDAKFGNETDIYSQSQFAIQTQYVSEESKYSFQGIENENDLTLKMERYIRDCDVKSKGESSSKMLLVYFYEQRCAKIQDSQEGYIGDALFELVDEFFQKAINLDPSNYRIQYNRYTLYYNSAVLLKKQSRVKGLSSYEVTALQKKSTEFMAAASSMAQNIKTEK